MISISPSESLEKLLDKYVENTGHSVSSRHLRSLLADGANAPVTGEADAQYFTRLREYAASCLP